MAQWLLLGNLVLSDVYRIREALDEDAVERYSSILASLPPIKVARMNGQLFLIDGFHRVEAAKRKGENGMMAEVFEVTEDVAYEMAVKANVLHGLPLRAKERRHAAEEMLKRFPVRSNRWVASDTGLSDHTVESIRENLERSAQIAHSQYVVSLDGRRWPCACDACQPKPEVVEEDPWADVDETTPLVALKSAIEQVQSLRVETSPVVEVRPSVLDIVQATRSEIPAGQESMRSPSYSEQTTSRQPGHAPVSYLGDKRAELRRGLFNPLVRIREAIEELEAGDFHEAPIDWIDEAMTLLQSIEGRSSTLRYNLGKTFDWKKEREPLANKVLSMADHKRA